MSRTTISREQLHEEVWSKPIVQLAKTYGLSDVGLAKLCKRHDIPRPPRGYWARLEAGQSPRKTPLPPSDGTVEIVISLPDEDSKAVKVKTRIREIVEEEKPDKTSIVIAENLRGAHPLVLAAREELSRAKRGESGLLVCEDELSLNISVSKDQLQRSLLIFDALLKTLESRRYDVAKGPQVTILGECIAFGIKELTDVERKQPNEHDLSGPYRFGFNQYNSRYIPNGKLSLTIRDADVYWASGCRKQWRDGKKQRLEDVLDRVVTGLVEVAAHNHERTVAEEQRRLTEREIARQRAELKARQDAERSRLDNLLKLADGFRKSQEIRQLIEAVTTANPDRKAELDEWCQWAMMQADRLDPTKDSPPSVLDEKLPEEPRRW